MIDKIKAEVSWAAEEICAVGKLEKGQILVVGCSSSEVLGEEIGSHSSVEVGEAIYEALAEVLDAKGIYLAAQCCEHLNRALVLERAALQGQDRVSAIPQPKAGGSFATAAYKHFKDPVLVEKVRADAGLDIGGTLIGMHLKEVAVPVRLGIRQVGAALLIAARTRPRLIGGARAIYDEDLS